MPATQESRLEEELFETIESAQGLMVDSVKMMSERVGEFRPADLPEPKVVWTKSFDLVERVLENQRKFGLALMEAMTSHEQEAA